MKEIEKIIDDYNLNCTVKQFETNFNGVQDKVIWFFVSINYELSEFFLEKYFNKLSSIGVSEYQQLSEKFLIKHKYKINWSSILNNNWYVPILTMKNKYVKYYKIYENIYVYINDYKTKRYLFLKGINYEEIDKYLIVIKENKMYE